MRQRRRTFTILKRVRCSFDAQTNGTSLSKRAISNVRACSVKQRVSETRYLNEIQQQSFREGISSLKRKNTKKKKQTYVLVRIRVNATTQLRRRVRVRIYTYIVYALIIGSNTAAMFDIFKKKKNKNNKCTITYLNDGGDTLRSQSIGTRYRYISFRY